MINEKEMKLFKERVIKNLKKLSLTQNIVNGISIHHHLLDLF